MRLKEPTNMPELPPEDSSLFGFDSDEEPDRWLELAKSARAPLPAGRLGSYEDAQEVSRGGQGVVFRALQPGTHRPVALKRLRAGSLAGTAMRRRFEREIEAASQLRHPGIVTVYGMELVDGEPLLAMEWIEGRSTREWALGADGPRPGVRAVLELFEQICAAVHHAHQNGVLHRDLKPSNILVDANDAPHVLDFGLAKEIGADAEHSDLTMSSDFVGTPAYASPEQLDGGSARLDVQSDVYSLGVVLYEMLAGERPYDQSGGLREFLGAIERGAHVPPSRRRSGVSRDLDLVTGKALAHDRAQRYQSVDALLSDVRRVLAGEAVLAHPPSVLYQLRKMVRRHPVAWSCGFLALSTVLALGGFAGWQSIELARQRDEAFDARAAEEQERERAEAALTFLLEDMLLGGDPSWSARDGVERHLDSRQMVDVAAARVQERFGQDPVQEASVREMLGRIFLSQGRPDEAISELERAIALREEHTPDAVFELAESQHELCRALHRASRFTDARAVCEQALFDLEALRLDDPSPVLSLLSTLGYISFEQNDYPTTKGWYERLKAAHEAAGQTDQPAYFQFLSNYGNLLREAGETEASAALVEPAYERCCELFGDECRPAASLLRVKSLLAGEAGDLAGEERMLRRLLEIKPTYLQTPHPGIVRTKADLAYNLMKQTRIDEGEALCLEGIAEMRTFAGGPTREEAVLHRTLSKGHLVRRDFAAAVASSKKAVEVSTAVHGEAHFYTLLAWNELVQHKILASDHRAAAESLFGFLDLASRSDAPSEPDLARNAELIARGLQQSEDIWAAIEFLELLTERIRDLRPELRDTLPAILRVLAQLYRQDGEAERANELEAEADEPAAR